MLDIFLSLRKIIREGKLNEAPNDGKEEVLDMGAPKDLTSNSEVPPPPDEIKDEEEQTDEQEIRSGIKSGEKIYLGSSLDAHFYLVYQDDDVKLCDAAGKVIMSMVDKMGEEADPADPKSQMEFIKVIASEVKPNISAQTLEQFGFFDEQPDEAESTMGEATPVLGAGSDAGMPASATGGGNPANPIVGDETVADGGDAMTPEPPKKDYDPITKETDASGLDQLEVGRHDDTPVSDDSTEGQPEANGDTPVEDDGSFDETAGLVRGGEDWVGGEDGVSDAPIAEEETPTKTPNPAYRRTVESLSEGKFRLKCKKCGHWHMNWEKKDNYICPDCNKKNEGKISPNAKHCPKCGDEIGDSANKDVRGVTCGGCGKSFKVDEGYDPFGGDKHCKTCMCEPKKDDQGDPNWESKDKHCPTCKCQNESLNENQQFEMGDAVKVVNNGENIGKIGIVTDYDDTNDYYTVEIDNGQDYEEVQVFSADLMKVANLDDGNDYQDDNLLSPQNYNWNIGDKVQYKAPKYGESGYRSPKENIPYQTPKVQLKNVQVSYSIDLDNLNDLYVGHGGQGDVEDALAKFDPLALKLARQIVEGELYYVGVSDAVVKSVELRLGTDSKYYSTTTNLDVVLDVGSEEDLTKIDVKDSPFQVVGGRGIEESIRAKFGLEETKKAKPKEDEGNAKVINTIYKEALRGLAGKESPTKEEIIAELDQVAKYVDANTPVKHVVYMKLLKKFRRAKPVKETGDSERKPIGYEASLEETLKKLSDKFIL